MDTTIAALATPPGIGGVAVVRISGANAYEVASKVFAPKDASKKLINAKGYTALYGYFLQEGKVYDEVVALCFRGPKSYTGEDVVELSCHGGKAVTDLLLRALYANGAEPAQKGEFTKRAFLSGRISLTEAEAVIDMINADTKKAALSAATAMEGALYKKIEKVRARLLVLAGHIAAYTDYPEEDVPELETTVLTYELSLSKNEIKSLLDNYDKGALIKSGIKTAIVGSPNVGKSTLLNLLSGFERAIVTPIAGTTRDIVEQEITLAGIKLILSDTAGMRETTDEIEAEGIRRSYAQMENADLIVAVFDASRKETAEDINLAKMCEGRVALGILNKSDLDKAFDAQKVKPYFKSFITISAKEQEFLAKVEQSVETLLGTNQIDTSAPLLTNERQFVAAQKAYEAIESAHNAANLNVTLDAIGVCIDDALNALYALTGENASAEIIDEVFSKFCVGK